MVIVLAAGPVHACQDGWTSLDVGEVNTIGKNIEIRLDSKNLRHDQPDGYVVSVRVDGHLVADHLALVQHQAKQVATSCGEMTIAGDRASNGAVGIQVSFFGARKTEEGRDSARWLLGTWTGSADDRGVDRDHSYKEQCVFEAHRQWTFGFSEYDVGRHQVSGGFEFSQRSTGTYDPDGLGRRSAAYDRHDDECSEAENTNYVIRGTVYAPEMVAGIYTVEVIEDSCSGQGCPSVERFERRLIQLQNGQLEYQRQDNPAVRLSRH